MLRRRILASAMASVMALGSVAIVAGAEETAVKPVKTRADLEALVGANGTYGDAYRSNDIYNYGTVFGEQMLATLEFADTVLDNADATVDDFTAAYDMVVAVAERFQKKSVTQLKELLAACKGAYETDNINNEEIGDLIYDPAKFATFADAYAEAESVLDTTDERIITDAYLGLEAAKNDLTALTTVTKTQFTSTIKALERAFDKEMAYDQWRRGTTTTPGTFWWTGTFYDNSQDFWGATLMHGQTQITYGEMFDWFKNYNKFIYDAYNEFVEVKSASKTTKEDFVLAYQIASEIVHQITNWKADDTNRATKASVTKLIDKYHGNLVFEFAHDDAAALYEMVYNFVVKTNGKKLEIEVNEGINDTKYRETTSADDATFAVIKGDNGKISSASLTVKSEIGYYILLDNDGYATGIAAAAPTDGGKYKKISAGAKVDLTDFVEVTAADVAAADDHFANDVWDADGYLFGLENDFWTADTIVKDYTGDPTSAAGEDNYVTLGSNGTSRVTGAYGLALAYLAADKIADNTAKAAAFEASGIREYDTIKQIALDTAKGSAAEWTIVYRALKYALEDRYGGQNEKFTKKDVAELIELSYELEAKTSKAAIFADAIDDMIDARELARTWLKAANAERKYKDNITPIVINGNVYYATGIYKQLKNKYDKLSQHFDAFSLSYEDVYNLIAQVEDMINEGEIEETPELRAAISEAAYRLAVVAEPDHTPAGALDDAPYSADRELIGFNRIFTNKAMEPDWTDTKYDNGLTILGTGVVINKSVDHRDLTRAYNKLVELTTAKPEELKGDYDGNGVVNALDAAAILKDIAAAAELKAIGDYDANGVVNALDASAILKAVADGVL